MSLQEIIEQLTVTDGDLVEVHNLGDTSSELHHGLHCGAALQRFIGSMELGHCLLQQRRPKFFQLNILFHGKSEENVTEGIESLNNYEH